MGGGGACLGNVGNVPACAGNACQGSDACPPLKVLVKDGVRADIVTCLNALPAPDCAMNPKANQDKEIECIASGLAKACDDADAKTQCAACNATPLATCVLYFNGLTASGKGALTNCVTHEPSCTEDALKGCLGYIVF
jgi:hypothetical protein